MSDFGFDDEASRRRRTATSDAELGRPRDIEPPRRRPWGTVLVLVGVLALAGIVGWSWSNRLHADDLDAYLVMRNSVVEFERAFDPVGQGERNPCGVTVEGWRELSWPTGAEVTVGRLRAYAVGKGWQMVDSESSQGADSRATLTRTTDNHLLTLVIEQSEQRGIVLTATSEASAFGCFLR